MAWLTGNSVGVATRGPHHLTAGAPSKPSAPGLPGGRGQPGWHRGLPLGVFKVQENKHVPTLVCGAQRRGAALTGTGDERPRSSLQQNRGGAASAEGRVPGSYTRRKERCCAGARRRLFLEGQNSPAVILAPYPGERIYDNTSHALC